MDRMSHDLEANKRNAIDFYLMACPGDDQYVTMDLFRFDAGGKFVEHWDAIQSVPAETQSGHTMY